MHYDTRPLPELTKLLNDTDEDLYRIDAAQPSSSVFAVAKHPASVDTFESFESQPVEFVRLDRSDASVPDNCNKVDSIDTGKKVNKTEYSGSVHEDSQSEIRIESQFKLTPPHKLYLESIEDFSDILAPGNDVMLSDALINRSPEQDMKLSSFDQWQFEPVTPSRWSDFGGPCRTPQYKVTRSHLLV